MNWNGMEIDIVSRGRHNVFCNADGMFYADGIDEHGNTVELVFESVDECEDGYGAYVDGNDVYVYVDIEDMLSDAYKVVDVYRI